MLAPLIDYKIKKEVIVMTKKIIWFSRHPAIPKQVGELKRLFGEDIEVIQDPKPFANADDVIKRYKKMGGDEMVIVAPLSVIDAICKKGIKPLWAEMEQVPADQADVNANGRGYKFIKFRRVKRLVLEFEDVID